MRWRTRWCPQATQWTLRFHARGRVLDNCNKEQEKITVIHPPSPLPSPRYNGKHAFPPDLSNLEFALSQRQVPVVVAPLVQALVNVLLDRYGGSRGRGVTLMLERC